MTFSGQKLSGLQVIKKEKTKETLGILADSEIPFPKEARLNSVVYIQEEKYIQRRTMLSMAVGFNPRNKIDEALLRRLLAVMRVDINTLCRSNLLYHPFRQGKIDLIKYILAHGWQLNWDCECRFVDVMEAFEKYNQPSKAIALKAIREMIEAPARINFAATKNNLTALAKACSLKEEIRADFIKEIILGIKVEGAQFILDKKIISEEYLNQYIKSVTKGIPEESDDLKKIQNELKESLSIFLPKNISEKSETLDSGEKKVEEKELSIGRVKRKYELIMLLNNLDFLNQEKKSRVLLREMIKENQLGCVYLLINHVEYEFLLDLFIEVLKNKSQYQFAIINILLSKLNKNKKAIGLALREYLTMELNANPDLSVVLLRTVYLDFHISLIRFSLVELNLAVVEKWKSEVYSFLGSHHDFHEMMNDWLSELKVHAKYSGKAQEVDEELDILEKVKAVRGYVDFRVKKAREDSIFSCSNDSYRLRAIYGYKYASAIFFSIVMTDVSDAIEYYLEIIRLIRNNNFEYFSALFEAYNLMVSFDYAGSCIRDKSELDLTFQKFKQACTLEFNIAERNEMLNCIKTQIKQNQYVLDLTPEQLAKLYHCYDIVLDNIPSLSKEQLQERLERQRFTVENLSKTNSTESDIVFWFGKLVDTWQALLLNTLLKDLRKPTFWVENIDLFYKIIEKIYNEKSAENLSDSLDKVYALIGSAIEEIKISDPIALNLYRYQLMEKEIILLKRQKSNFNVERLKFLHDKVKLDIAVKSRLEAKDENNLALCFQCDYIMAVAFDESQDKAQAEKHWNEVILAGFALLEKIANHFVIVFHKILDAILFLQALNQSDSFLKHFNQLSNLIGKRLNEDLPYNRNLLIDLDKRNNETLSYILEKELFEYEPLKSLIAIKESILFQLAQNGQKEKTKQAKKEAIEKILQEMKTYLERAKKLKNGKLLESAVQICIDICCKSYFIQKSFCESKFKELFLLVNGYKNNKSDDPFFLSVKNSIQLINENWRKSLEQDRPALDLTEKIYYQHQSVFADLKNKATQYIPLDTDKKDWDALMQIGYKNGHIVESDVVDLENHCKNLKNLIQRASKIIPEKEEVKPRVAKKSKTKGKQEYEQSLERKKAELLAREHAQEVKQAKNLKPAQTSASLSTASEVKNQSASTKESTSPAEVKVTLLFSGKGLSAPKPEKKATTNAEKAKSEQKSDRLTREQGIGSAFFHQGAIAVLLSEEADKKDATTKVIRHFALLYHLVRYFVLLKGRLPTQKEDSHDMRHLVVHYILKIIHDESLVLACAKDILNKKLSRECLKYFSSSKHQYLEPYLQDAKAGDEALNIQNTLLYQTLRPISDRADTTEIKDAQKQFDDSLGYMKNVLGVIEKQYKDDKGGWFLNALNHQDEIQEKNWITLDALKILLMFCGELVRHVKGKAIKKKLSNFTNFRGSISHEDFSPSIHDVLHTSFVAWQLIQEKNIKAITFPEQTMSVARNPSALFVGSAGVGAGAASLESDSELVSAHTIA